MSSKPRKTLDDIDSDDDYIPKAAVVASASSPHASSSAPPLAPAVGPSAAVGVSARTHQPTTTTHVPSSGNRVCSAAAAAVDDFFGITTATTAHKSSGGNSGAVNVSQSGRQSAYGGVASPKGVVGGGTDFFDDFFGGASTQPTTTRQQLNASPNTSNNKNTAQSSSSNNTNALGGGGGSGAANDDFLLDISAKPSVQRHVTSDPLQYLEMATGGGTRLKPRADPSSSAHHLLMSNNNNTISGKASLGAAGGISSSSSGSKFGSGADNGTAHILGNPFLLSRMTHYDVLGVTELLAEQEEISRAYKKKCLTLHPDRVVGREQTEAEKTYFKAVVKAHEVLSDEESRREYDELLREHRASGGVGPPPVPGAEGVGGTATAGFGGGGGGGGNTSSNVDQNAGGWDFLDEDAASKGGLGDFAPKQQQKTTNVVSPAGATSAEDPFFTAATAAKPSGFSFGSAKVTPLHADDGWGNFSGSSHPSSNFGTNSARPQPQPSGGGGSSLFGGQPRATIDDLFS